MRSTKMLPRLRSAWFVCCLLGVAGGLLAQTRSIPVKAQNSQGSSRPAQGFATVKNGISIPLPIYAAYPRSLAEKAAISAVAFSPNGKSIALGGYRTVILRNAAKRSVEASLTGHAGSVTSLAFSPNGEFLAAAGGSPGKSGEVKLWSIHSAKPLLTLQGPVDMIYSVAFRPDGKQIAACSYDHSLTLWNLPERFTPGSASSLQPSARLLDHTDAVYAVAYSPDGSRLASAGGDRTVKVWDVKNGKRLYTLNDSTAELYALAFRPDGRQLAAGGVDKALRIWNLTSDGGALSRTAFAHEAAILRVLYTHDGRSLLTSGEDNAVKRWNAETLDEEKDYPHQTDWPQGLAVSPTGDKIAVGCQDGTFSLYSLEKPLLSTSLCGAPDTDYKQAPDNDTPARAQNVALPSSINGTLWNGKPNTPAPIHFYRFHGHKGEKLSVEVLARRMGSPLDSIIAVCDLQGKPIERAVLRAVGQTEITLFDKDSVSPGIRLFLRPDMHLNDYVLVGRELLRIGALPKGPDDDYQFRSYRGQRVGYLGTTPEYHSIGAAAYKVEVHPPGTLFSPNGMPLSHLLYVNDDGGPLYTRDSYLEFSPPADADYLVRITDTRGQQGDKFTYRLNIHPPRPDFKIVSSPPSPSIPRGGGDTISIECERYEGFDGEIALRLEGLPPGVVATQSTIEAGETNATLLITGMPTAETPSTSAPLSYRLVATAQIDGKEVLRTIEPDAKSRLIKLLPPANVTVGTDVKEVKLQPGHETYVEVHIQRLNGFGGRVPIDVRNLPFGVRVLDVGLNGVLITEKDTSRKFGLYCEPWVRPQTRSIYVMALPEGQQGTAAPPIQLRIGSGE